MPAAVLSSREATLIDLTDRHLDSVSRGQRMPFLTRMVFKFLWFFWKKKGVKIFNQAAARDIDQAIWFDGAAKLWWQQNVDVLSFATDLLPKLQSIKNDVMSGRASMLRVEAQARKLNAFELADAAKAAAGEAASLFEAVENFRCTLLELEANHSARTEGYVANTREEFDAMFERMRLEA